MNEKIKADLKESKAHVFSNTYFRPKKRKEKKKLEGSEQS